MAEEQNQNLIQMQLTLRRLTGEGVLMEEREFKTNGRTVEEVQANLDYLLIRAVQYEREEICNLKEDKK